MTDYHAEYMKVLRRAYAQLVHRHRNCDPLCSVGADALSGSREVPYVPECPCVPYDQSWMTVDHCLFKEVTSCPVQTVLFRAEQEWCERWPVQQYGSDDAFHDAVRSRAI